MKKFYILLLIFSLSFFVTGCGKETEEKQKDEVKDVAKEEKSETKNDGPLSVKVCSLDDGEGLVQTFKYSATDGEVDKVEITKVYDSKLFGVTNLENLSNSEKEDLKSAMLEDFGIKSTKDEGISVSFDIQKKMTININVDLETVDSGVLNKVGITFQPENRVLDSYVEMMETSGAICK